MHVCFALKRILHGIHNMRFRHPLIVILLGKTDMDSAYRRLHVNWSSAVTCITILDELAYLLNRLPFGSESAPAKFSVISDTITDIAFDLALDPSWDPTKTKSSFPVENKPHILDEAISFDQADTPLFNLPPRNIIFDNYIDDILDAALMFDNNILRLQHATPVVLEAIFRKHHIDDATERNNIINLIKHLAEGTLSERNTFLGWIVDTRQFRVFLDNDKANDWLFSINSSSHNHPAPKSPRINNWSTQPCWQHPSIWSLLSYQTSLLSHTTQQQP